MLQSKLRTFWFWIAIALALVCVACLNDYSQFDFVPEQDSTAPPADSGNGSAPPVATALPDAGL